MTDVERLDQEAWARLRVAGWPESLIKATIDPFVYLVVLRGGEQAMVEHVSESETAGWCVLHLIEGTSVYDSLCPRGLEVRVAEIVAIADAPFGS